MGNIGEADLRQSQKFLLPAQFINKVGFVHVADMEWQARLRLRALGWLGKQIAAITDETPFTDPKERPVRASGVISSQVDNALGSRVSSFFRGYFVDYTVRSRWADILGCMSRRPSRWTLAVAVAVLSFMACTVHKRHTPPAEAQVALENYSQQLHPGTTRKTIEDYLKAHHTVFAERCCTEGWKA